MKTATYILLALLFTIILSCKKIYTPQLVSVSTNYLAVDGPIVSGDSTFIRLSRTTGLTDTTQNKAELKAIVAVESDQNALYTLSEKGKGLYVLGVTNFDKNRKYRLDIKTGDGKVYQSDFVQMKVTPAIDSIYINKTAANEITFYSDAHDSNNSTRYYRWDYKDTWSYVPIYHANYQYKNGAVSFITPGSADDIGTCYRWSNSTQIIIGSTDKLAQDIMSKQVLFALTDVSEKIAHIYTIQLHQYALTKEGFEYYQNLKKNSEQLGSIFDAQPSSLNGNIHCLTSPNDLVIGFVSASTIANKQFNLHTNDDPLRPPLINLGITGINPYAYPTPYYETCATNFIHNDPYGQGYPWSFSGPAAADLAIQPTSFINRANRSFAKGDSLLYDIQFSIGTYTYLYAPKQCVDCRVRGGTNIRPAYYPTR